MCLNRVETADSLCIVQAFSPCLFQQDDLTGPDLFLKFWQGKLTEPQHYEKWKKDLDQKKSKSITWPQDMRLFCRGCSDAAGVPKRVCLKNFPRKSKTDLFATVTEGMERFCNGCRSSGRVQNVGAVGNDVDTGNRKRDDEEYEDSRYVPCTGCKAVLWHTYYDQEKLRTWRKDRHVGTRAVCLQCEQLPPLPKEKLPKPVFCVKCRRDKDSSAFDPVLLARWRQNRDLSKKAECNNCRAKRDVTTQPPKKVWQRSEYPCNKMGKKLYTTCGRRLHRARVPGQTYPVVIKAQPFEMQNLSFRILDKLAGSTAPTETAFANATTITWGVSQEHIPYVGRHVNPSLRKSACLEVGTTLRVSR